MNICLINFATSDRLLKPINTIGESVSNRQDRKHMKKVKRRLKAFLERKEADPIRTYMDEGFLEEEAMRKLAKELSQEFMQKER